MDNCRFHHRRNVIALLNAYNIPSMFLPAYSPQLNPIEEFFGVIKARYKNIRPRPNTRNQIITNLEVILEDSKNENLLPYFLKAKSFLGLAIAGTPFL